MSPSPSESRTSPSGIDLYGVLSDPSSMAFFLEFMERRSRSRLVQFWLTIEGFKDPLESAGRFSALENVSTQAIASTVDSENATIAEDVSFLYLAYFAESDHTSSLGVPAKHQGVIRDFATNSGEPNSGHEITQVKLAIFSAQDAAYVQMEEDDWPAFRKSELYRKALANLERVSAPELPPLPPLPQRTISNARSVPPPQPTRQNTAPALLAGLTSPSQRAAPRLINGNFASSKLESSISMVLPDRVVSNGSQSSQHQTRPDNPRIHSDLPHATPSLTRGSSHFDVLMSASQQKERDPLFEDEEGDHESEATARQRMAAIQAALNEIIATDDMTASRMSLSNTLSPRPDEMRSPTASMVSLPFSSVTQHTRLGSKSVENMKGDNAGEPGPQRAHTIVEPANGPKSPRTPRLSNSLPIEKGPSRVLFDEDLPDETGEETEPQEVTSRDMVRLAEPGNLHLGPEIDRLQDRIQELVKQEHVLDTLISQAELTGKQAELRLLHRSQSSIRQETRACIFQKAQYEQQEEENRLAPGKTGVSVPSHVDTREDGKQVVRYIVRIEQVDEAGKIVLGWNVARRYNEFHDLDREVREWASSGGDKTTQTAVKKQVAELPGKKLVPVLSSQQLDGRRSGLQRYLQVSSRPKPTDAVVAHLGSCPLCISSSASLPVASTGSLAEAGIRRRCSRILCEQLGTSQPRQVTL